MNNLLIIRQKNLMSELKIRRNFLEGKLLATGPNMMKVRYALHVSVVDQTSCSLLQFWMYASRRMLLEIKYLFPFTERTDMFDSTLHQDSEEALQDRLLQLFNLPTTHTTPSLTDIGDVSSVSNSTPELEESSNFLTLDCNALAKALSTLPLYQLLDIDPEVLGEKDEMENPPQNKLDSVHIGLPSSSPATVASLRGTSEAADVFDLSQSLRKVAVVKEEASGEEDVGMCSVSSSQIRKESSPLARQQPHTKPSAATASSTDEDKRLDKLLSTSETNPPSQKYTRTTAKRVDEQGPTKIAMADSLHPPTTISAGEDENSELDDMLDELLA